MPDLYKKSTYRYHLPPELIAQYPPKKRDDCRLLCLNRQSGETVNYHFNDITSYLQNGDVLVINTSKVIPARLTGRKESGAAVEVLLLRELEEGLWECLVKPGNRLKKGAGIIFSDDLQGTIAEHDKEGIRRVEFHYKKDFWQILNKIGKMPLPPYIKRDSEQQDFLDYQTVYASEKGSAAAPTAGLHFTPEILHELQNKGVIITNVILHIGLDTFRPVKAENILDHQIHREYCSVPIETADIINSAKKEGRRIIAVGTTSVRTLESFAVDRSGQLEEGIFLGSGSQWSQLFIYPGFSFAIIDGLLTNFHLPESTLLMLVSAFAGYENILRAYKEAVRERYRFFSYGDAMLIL